MDSTVGQLSRLGKRAEKNDSLAPRRRQRMLLVGQRGFPLMKIEQKMEIAWQPYCLPGFVQLVVLRRKN
jgi:hypothetical protein